MTKTQGTAFCSVTELLRADKHRLHKEFDGRTVTVLGHQDKIYAFDAMCFHFGGPLGAGGDIEEIGNRPVISCPWHHQKVDLATGQHISTDLQRQVCLSTEAVQRVYSTKIDEAGIVWVDLAQSEERLIPSDKYNRVTPAQPSGYGYGLGSSCNQSWNIGACMPPSTPDTGGYKSAMSPSPIRNPEPQEQISYRAQKSVSMRNANARMAVLRKMAAQPARLPAGQQTLAESFSRNALRSSATMEP